MCEHYISNTLICELNKKNNFNFAAKKEINYELFILTLHLKLL